MYIGNVIGDNVMDDNLIFNMLSKSKRLRTGFEFYCYKKYEQIE